MPGDNTAVWDTSTGKEKLRLDTRGLAVAFSPDGRSLTSVSRTGLVQRWDLTTGKCAGPEGARREGFQYVCEAVSSADGKTLALSDHHSVVLKDAETGRTLWRFDDLAAECLALSADGKTLAVANDVVLLLDAATGKETGRLRRKKRAQLLTWEEYVHARAFSGDGNRLAVGHQTSVEVWDVAGLRRAGAARPAAEKASALEVTVVSRKDAYPLALGGKTPEEFARLFESGKGLPASPEVDLVLTVRNTSGKRLTIDPPENFHMHLVGDGALNHPELPYQTGISMEDVLRLEQRRITLGPGESHSVQIRSLDCGHSQQSYWLLPGEYTLHVSYHTSATPTPEGWEKSEYGTAFATLRAAPVRLKVTAGTR